jgi:hypothetical protein
MSNIDYTRGKILWQRIERAEKKTLTARWEFGRWVNELHEQAAYREIASALNLSSPIVQHHAFLGRSFSSAGEMLGYADEHQCLTFTDLMHELGRSIGGTSRHDEYTLQCVHCHSNEIECSKCGGTQFVRKYTRAIEKTAARILINHHRERISA